MKSNLHIADLHIIFVAMGKRPLRKRIKYSALYYFVKFLIFTANVMPRQWWLAFCGLLGSVAYHFVKDAREKVIIHLGLAYSGEKSIKEVIALSKQVFKMLGKNAGEILRALQVRTMADLDKVLVTHGIENFEAATAKGKGVIFRCPSGRSIAKALRA